MLKHLQPLPISEEMLGAYLEGNLTAEEVTYVDSALQTDELLKGIVDEVNRDGIDWTILADNTSIYQGLELMPDLQIPEIPTLAILIGGPVAAYVPFCPDIAVNAAFDDVDIEEIEMTEDMNTSVEIDEVKGFRGDMDNPTTIMNEDL